MCGNGCCHCGRNSCGRNTALAAREAAERLREGAAANTRCKCCCCGNDRPGGNPCRPAGTLGDFLYGGRAAGSPVLVTCCDRGCCRRFCLADRNPFWPAFAHPRWLCCKNLYCRP